MTKRLILLFGFLFLNGCSVTFTVMPGLGNGDHEVMVQEISHAK